MKRKNLKVGLRVVLKTGNDLNIPVGTVGVVEQVAPEEYRGNLPCYVKFEGRFVWVNESEIRIADKARKAVRLTDAEIQDARSTAVNNAPDDVLMGRIAGLGRAELRELSRAIEAAVLAANGLGDGV